MYRIAFIVFLVSAACGDDLPPATNAEAADIVADATCERAASCGLLDLRWGYPSRTSCESMVRDAYLEGLDAAAEPDAWEWGLCEESLAELDCGWLYEPAVYLLVGTCFPR